MGDFIADAGEVEDLLLVQADPRLTLLVVRLAVASFKNFDAPAGGVGEICFDTFLEL